MHTSIGSVWQALRQAQCDKIIDDVQIENNFLKTLQGLPNFHLLMLSSFSLTTPLFVFQLLWHRWGLYIVSAILTLPGVDLMYKRKTWVHFDVGQVAVPNYWLHPCSSCYRRSVIYRRNRISFYKFRVFQVHFDTSTLLSVTTRPNARIRVTSNILCHAELVEALTEHVKV